MSKEFVRSPGHKIRRKDRLDRYSELFRRIRACEAVVADLPEMWEPFKKVLEFQVEAQEFAAKMRRS
jgi:hypothetical protein